MNDELKKLQEPDGSCETCEHFRSSGGEHCGGCVDIIDDADNDYIESKEAHDDRMEKIHAFQLKEIKI